MEIGMLPYSICNHVRPIRCNASLVSICMASVCMAITSMVAALPAQTESAWPFQKRVDTFHFHSDRPIDSLSEIETEFADLSKQIRHRLGIENAKELVHVVVIDSEEHFRKYVRHYFPKAPERRALFVKDRGPGILFAYRNPEMLVDLRHECTHAIVQAVLPEIPLWLDEGIAEYFETPLSVSTTHPAHQASMVWHTRLGYVPNLQKLEQIRDVAAMTANDYRDAWSWVEFLLGESEESAATLYDFLKDVELKRTTGFLSHRMERTLPNWRDRFINYFQDRTRIADARTP